MKSNNQKFDNKKTEQYYCSCGGSSKQIAITAVAIVLMAVFAVYANSWKQTKDEKVSLGLSSPDFPYRDYTQEELDKMYPQIKNADVPTRTTPEQTYAKLKQSLKNEDIDAAVDCFMEEKREEWRENFQRAKNENFIKQLADDLSEQISEVYTYEAISRYETLKIVNGSQTAHVFDFIKDSNGDWKIKNL